MIKLFEILLKELTEKSTLYRRTNSEYKIGDTMISKKSQDKSAHWLEDFEYEKMLEWYRKEYFPNKPSRFDCIYTTVVPSTRFNSKGKLYEVKIIPGSKWHLTNSNIIDLISMESDAQKRENLCMEYWNPSSKWISKSQTKSLEILCEKVIVTDISEEKNILHRKDVIKITKDMEFKNVAIDLYDDEIEELKSKDKNVKNIKILKTLSKNTKLANLYFKKGTPFEIVSSYRADRLKDKKKYNDIVIAYHTDVITGRKLFLIMIYNLINPKKQKEFLNNIIK